LQNQTVSKNQTVFKKKKKPTTKKPLKFSTFSTRFFHLITCCMSTWVLLFLFFLLSL